MTRTSYLRVYLPLAELSQLEPHESDQAGNLRASRFGLLGEPLTDDGLLVEWFGERYMCPRNTRLRVLQGVLAFHNAFEEMGARLIVPESAARLAAEELDGLRRSRPELRSYILTSAWHVPPRWFLAFDRDEKELIDDGGSVAVRYRTRRLSATGRISRALDALNDAGFNSDITAEIEELAEWMAEFPEDALVELDYGSVAEMFHPQDLVTDDSAEEIWESVEALEAGDLVEARNRYVEMASKWSMAMAVGFNS